MLLDLMIHGSDMRTILDTSLLIADHIPPLQGEMFISVASIAELHQGVLSVANETERARRLTRFSDVVSTFETIPITQAVAASYGELAAATIRAGGQPRGRVMDLFIAATAHAHQAKLATADFADVEHLSDLIEIIPIKTRA